MKEFMPPKPYWVENKSEAELRAELDQLNAALDRQNPQQPGDPLPWSEQVRLEERRKTVKRLLSEAESRRQHEQAQLRKPLTAEDAGCGRLRRVTHAPRLMVPDAVEFAQCQAEKEAISRHLTNAREPRFMPPRAPGR